MDYSTARKTYNRYLVLNLDVDKFSISLRETANVRVFIIKIKFESESSAA